jgi:1,4-alpha-glucan branching enzyme
MDTIIQDSSGIRYSARSTAKPINFYCNAPGARAVHLVADFNQWNATAHPMRQQVDGWWFLQVMVTHGHHRYRFLVDGQPVLDPRAAGTASDDLQGEVSLVAVS